MLHQMESSMKGMAEIKKVLNEVMTTTALKNYLRRNKFMIYIQCGRFTHVGLNAQLALYC